MPAQPPSLPRAPLTPEHVFWWSIQCIPCAREWSMWICQFCSSRARSATESQKWTGVPQGVSQTVIMEWSTAVVQDQLSESVTGMHGASMLGIGMHPAFSQLS